MPRPLPIAVLFGLSAAGLSLGQSGCSSMLGSVGTRTIEQFAASLESGDFDTLQSLATPEFQTAALPDKSSLGTFDLVGLPVGDVTVEETEEVSPNHQRVTARVGDGSQTLVYDIVRSGPRQPWRVDEITMTRGKGSAAVSRTVSEQMELLLSVRDIIRSWQREDLSEAIADAERPLAQPLTDLPATWQSQIAGDFFGGVLRGAPKAKLVDGQARIDLSHKTGRLRMLLARTDAADATSGWTLRTAILTEGRDSKTVRDLRTEAVVLGTAARFLTAAAAADLDAAAADATEGLAKNTLAIVERDDVQSSNVPLADLLNIEYELRQEATRTDVSLKIDDRTTHQVAVRTARPGDEDARDPKVEEITTFAGDEVIRWSASLTLEPRLRQFHEALLAADVPTLDRLSVKAFSDEVWRHWTSRRDDVFGRLVLGPLGDAKPEVTWSGPQMEVVYVTPGGRVAYQLRSAEQSVLVDDVTLTDAGDAPRSLRLELGALMAMDELADGLLSGDRLLIRRSSTPELSTMVWDLQAPEDLPAELDLLPTMRSLPRTITETPLDTLVDCGETTVVMRRDAGRLKVDDVIYRGDHGEEVARFAFEVRKARTRNAITE